MSNPKIFCWKCGQAQEDILLPLARLAKCKNCHADLHCCRECRFFDTTVSKQCREPVAEEVQDKKRANFCGYLEPIPSAHKTSGADKKTDDMAGLADLFGLKSDAGTSNKNDADEARRKLEDLFRKD
ncbi:MAG: hypothetical protein EPO31_13080 [Gammaproteobacteria bacterium]|nr:MAG: hypothetical protein EPO31_13080 [Gammaproteobacteria bacterium]